ncbi:MAG: DUF2238 domain-containing protein [Gemmatimonadales bacterium]
MVVTWVRAYDRGTWVMEVFPIFLAAPVLIWTWYRFPLSSLLYALIAIHALILITGGAYTYARVPLGFWIEHAFHMSRNPYDKIGHFAQGLVPALIAREVFLRKRIVKPGGWTTFLSMTVALSVSLIYELIEWGAAVSMGQGADAFLGTQGDPWDTQTDMGMALVGASIAMLFFRRWQDRQIARLSLPAGSVPVPSDRAVY